MCVSMRLLLCLPWEQISSNVAQRRSIVLVLTQQSSSLTYYSKTSPSSSLLQRALYLKQAVSGLGTGVAELRSSPRVRAALQNKVAASLFCCWSSLVQRSSDRLYLHSNSNSLATTVLSHTQADNSMDGDVAPAGGRPTPEIRKRVASGKRQRGVLSELIGQEVGLYQEMLQFVLMSGGPSVGFETSELDPLAQPHIALTLANVAAALMEEASRIVLPSVSALMTSGQLPHSPCTDSPSRGFGSPSPPTPPGEIHAKAATMSTQAMDVSVAATANHTTGSELQFSPEQRAHYDDAVYYVTIATTPASMDQVLEELSHRAVKRGILDALLYGMSLMCRYPVRSDLEDETGRPIREVMVQATVNIFVNLDVLCDLQFLNATRGCRVCDLIRWCVGTKKRPLLDLAVGLSVRLVQFCFPRLPADAEMPMMECTHYTDAVRRMYCGYDDCESVVTELAAMKRPETWQCFKDVLFLLDEARRHFVAVRPTATNAEAQVLADKQHPWMVAGPPKALHYLSTVPLRALEQWLGVRAEPERALHASEAQCRTDLVSTEGEARRSLCDAFEAVKANMYRQAAWTRICMRAHEEEMDARLVVEEAYRERCDSIQDDLRRLRWHATHRPPIAISTSKATTPDVRSCSAATEPAAAPMPRFYFLEVVALDTIHSIEAQCREETVRHQRYAFSAIREAWDMDLQWIHEVLAEATHEKYLREERRQEMLRQAEAMADEEIAIARRLRGSALSTIGTTTRAPSSSIAAGAPQTRRYPTASAAASPVPIAGNNSVFGPIGVFNGAGALSCSRAASNLGHGQFRNVVSPTSSSTVPVPPMYYGYDYHSPHSTAPSSLGFGPKAPELIGRPTSMLRMTSETPHNYREYLPLTAHYDGADDGVGSRYPPQHDIVVTARVTSPSIVGPTTRTGMDAYHPRTNSERHMGHDAQYGGADEVGYEEQQQWSAAAVSYFFFGRYQDLLDDQDIERSLVEDEEASLRKAMQQRLREGRLMQFDWSMSGYRRLITSYSRQQSSSPRPVSSILSSRSGMTTYPHPLLPKAPDRHLPSNMRSRSGAASRTQQLSAASLSPAPCVAVHTSRPTSRLLQQVLFTPEGRPPPRYGAAGTTTPNVQFMPRRHDGQDDPCVRDRHMHASQYTGAAALRFPTS